MWAVIVPALATIVVAVVESIAARERQANKEEREKQEARAERRAEETQLSMQLSSANLQLSIATANALTGAAEKGDTEIICSRDSTEQGPAIIAKFPPPIFIPPMSITVSSGWNFLLHCLNGSLTFLTFSTMSRLAIRSISMFDVSPIRPKTV